MRSPVFWRRFFAAGGVFDGIYQPNGK